MRMQSLELMITQETGLHTSNNILHKLKIALLSYRSAPFSGGQGIFVKELSNALLKRGHEIDIISGPPMPMLDPGIKLIKLEGLNSVSYTHLTLPTICSV